MGLTPPTAAELASPDWPTAGYVAADNLQILTGPPPCDIGTAMYDRLWYLSSGVAPARRIQSFPGAVVAIAPARTGFDAFLRLACRNALGWPTLWNSAVGLTGAEQAAIMGVDAGYVPAAGNPKIVGYPQLFATPGFEMPGRSLERLPELLCQLGGKTRQSDFA